MLLVYNKVIGWYFAYERGNMPRIDGVDAIVIVKNKLTSQPQKGVSKLKTFVKSNDAYNIGVRQDYSKNRVELQLLSRTYMPQEGGFAAVQTRYIPVTSAAKAYTKTAKEMIQAERETVVPNSVKKSPLTKVLEFLGM